MIRRTAALVAAGTVLVSAMASAEDRPDFTGHWVIVAPESAEGQHRWVEQDAITLASGQGSGRKDPHVIYRLDGTESRTVIRSHGMDITLVSRASWGAGRLTILRATLYPDGPRMKEREVWSLDAKGRLIVEVTGIPDRHPSAPVTMVHEKR